MIFEMDKNSKKLIAAIQRYNHVEKYACSVLTCDNPVCACNTVYLNLSPLETVDENHHSLSSHQVHINFMEKCLNYPSKKKIPKDELAFANAFLSALRDEDFTLLWKEYFTHKNTITEKANPDSIDAKFQYKEVEKEGVMYAYNDVLPYGDRLLMTIDGKKCIIFDQFCLRPKCACTDTILTIFSADISGKTQQELCIAAVTYAKKSWRAYDNQTFPVSVKTARSAIEDQIPDFYKKLRDRHLKLKSIYAHCKKKNYSPEQPLQVPKAGRNDPCPCGSGKKYKKCCGRQ